MCSKAGTQNQKRQKSKGMKLDHKNRSAQKKQLTVCGDSPDGGKSLQRVRLLTIIN